MRFYVFLFLTAPRGEISHAVQQRKTTRLGKRSVNSLTRKKRHLQLRYPSVADRILKLIEIGGEHRLIFLHFFIFSGGQAATFTSQVPLFCSRNVEVTTSDVFITSSFYCYLTLFLLLLFFCSFFSLLRFWFPKTFTSFSPPVNPYPPTPSPDL